MLFLLIKELKKTKGIDISSYQGKIEWSKVKAAFAIILLRYGDNTTTQDDKEFLNNVNGCINNKIFLEVYLYYYAKNLTGEESIQSEISHCKILLVKIATKLFLVYIDMEDNNTTYLGKTNLNNNITYQTWDYY